MTDRASVSLFRDVIQSLTRYLSVWTVWEQEAEKNRKAGVQAELDRRRDAEAMRQEIKGSIK